MEKRWKNNGESGGCHFWLSWGNHGFHGLVWGIFEWNSRHGWNVNTEMVLSIDPHLRGSWILKCTNDWLLTNLSKRRQSSRFMSMSWTIVDYPPVIKHDNGNPLLQSPIKTSIHNGFVFAMLCFEPGFESGLIQLIWWRMHPTWSTCNPITVWGWLESQACMNLTELVSILSVAIFIPWILATAIYTANQSLGWFFKLTTCAMPAYIARRQHKMWLLNVEGLGTLVPSLPNFLSLHSSQTTVTTISCQGRSAHRTNAPSNKQGHSARSPHRASMVMVSPALEVPKSYPIQIRV